MLESKMLAKLNSLFPEIMFQPIETSTSLGVPDIVYGHKNIQGWIELKELKSMPNCFDVSIPWRPGQLAWYNNYVHKYMNQSPYYLILTISDSWFMTDYIKQTYNKFELDTYYISETVNLSRIKNEIKRKLLRRVI